VYPKIATRKNSNSVAYFENVFSDWSIFKEAVLLSNQRFPNNSLCNTSSYFMSTPRCFPFRDILFVLNSIHLPVKVTGG
jgi:hypothetical protein